MDAQHLIFLALVFLVVAGLVFMGVRLFAPVQVRERLGGVVAPETPVDAPQQGWVEKVAHAAQPFSRLSVPEEGWERSPLRTRFMNAGWRSASAPSLYFAAKTVLALALPALATVLVALLSGQIGRAHV